MESKKIQKREKEINPQEWFMWNPNEKLYNYHYYCYINEFNEIKFSLGLKFYSFIITIDDNIINLYCSNIMEVPKNIDSISFIKIKTMPDKFIYGFTKLALNKFVEKNALTSLTNIPKNLALSIKHYKKETPFFVRKT